MTQKFFLLQFCQANSFFFSFFFFFFFFLGLLFDSTESEVKKVVTFPLVFYTY